MRVPQYYPTLLDRSKTTRALATQTFAWTHKLHVKRWFPCRDTQVKVGLKCEPFWFLSHSATNLQIIVRISNWKNTFVPRLFAKAFNSEIKWKGDWMCHWKIQCFNILGKCQTKYETRVHSWIVPFTAMILSLRLLAMLRYQNTKLPYDKIWFLRICLRPLPPLFEIKPSKSPSFER